jgi:hypothetical protein
MAQMMMQWNKTLNNGRVYPGKEKKPALLSEMQTLGKNFYIHHF